MFLCEIVGFWGEKVNSYYLDKSYPECVGGRNRRSLPQIAQIFADVMTLWAWVPPLDLEMVQEEGQCGKRKVGGN